MDVSDEITLWLEHLRQGDPEAVEQLWMRYFSRVVALARRRLSSQPRKAADDEDVALSVFDSFCRGVSAGKYPLLSSPDSLWPLLVVLTVRKACDRANYERRQKRGNGQVHAATELGPVGEDPFRMDALLSNEPTPETVAVMNETCERLFSQLDDDQRQIALGKLHGHSNQDLATQMNCGLRTIERRLDLIRRTWEQSGNAAQSR